MTALQLTAMSLVSSFFGTRCRVLCTRFGVDSSSRFPVRARTNEQTDATERLTHAGGYTAGMSNKQRLF